MNSTPQGVWNTGGGENLTPRPSPASRGGNGAARPNSPFVKK
jgi:hypothetical protein